MTIVDILDYAVFKQEYERNLREEGVLSEEDVKKLASEVSRMLFISKESGGIPPLSA